GGGALTSSKAPDAQAAYESMMCMWPTVLGRVNFVLHAAGWLESALLASYEKFAIDVEALRMFEWILQKGLPVDEEGMAMDALRGGAVAGRRSGRGGGGGNGRGAGREGRPPLHSADDRGCGHPQAGRKRAHGGRGLHRKRRAGVPRLHGGVARRAWPQCRRERANLASGVRRDSQRAAEGRACR